MVLRIEQERIFYVRAGPRSVKTKVETENAFLPYIEQHNILVCKLKISLARSGNEQLVKTACKRPQNEDHFQLLNYLISIAIACFGSSARFSRDLVSNPKNKKSKSKSKSTVHFYIKRK